MRAVFILLYVIAIATAWYFGSLTGWLVAAAVCFVLAAATFYLSMASKEARESKGLQRAMGRSTTFLAGLGRR